MNELQKPDDSRSWELATCRSSENSVVSHHFRSIVHDESESTTYCDEVQRFIRGIQDEHIRGYVHISDRPQLPLDVSTSWANRYRAGAASGDKKKARGHA